jgi:hypothetical protein
MVYIFLSSIIFLFLSFLQKDILSSFSFFILSFILMAAVLNDKIEKKKKARKDLFNSLITPRPKALKEGYSILITLKVPSQNFFNEMSKEV